MKMLGQMSDVYKTDMMKVIIEMTKFLPEEIFYCLCVLSVFSLLSSIYGGLQWFSSPPGGEKNDLFVKGSVIFGLWSIAFGVLAVAIKNF